MSIGRRLTVEVLGSTIQTAAPRPEVVSAFAGIDDDPRSRTVAGVPRQEHRGHEGDRETQALEDGQIGPAADAAAGDQAVHDDDGIGDGHGTTRGAPSP